MRIGENPAKSHTYLDANVAHRVVVPVHIPNLDGYHAQSLQILELCLQSIVATIDADSRVTIVSDASSDEVEEFLRGFSKSHPSIDQLFISRKGIGKMNALFSTIRSSIEPFITVTDCDVLFKAGWQEETRRIFQAFPEAGMVSPVPTTSSNSYASGLCSSTLFFGLTRACLQFSDVQDVEGLIRFNESINRPGLRESQLSKHMTLRRDEVSAVVGAGHFVATFKSAVFLKSPVEPSLHKILGSTEERYLDSPVNNSGYLRLSTRRNFAFHMGNHLEDWMLEEAAENAKRTKSTDMSSKEVDSVGRPLSAGEVFAGKLLNKLVLKKKTLRHYFQLMFGLNDREY